jgi:hypothetical protein
MTVLRWPAAAGRFFYGFIVGDDWSVAVVMLLALAVTAVLVANGIDAWWLVPPLAVVMTGVALRRRLASDQKQKTQRMELR